MGTLSSLAEVPQPKDNVDYNDIKHLIRIRTTRGQAQAISIPGRSDEGQVLKDFEDELFTELLEQHDRIGLFVRSKSGEIERRLKHLHRQVILLGQQDSPAARARISVRRLGKFSKAEEDVLKAGEEIQFLSRFVGAQRLGFQKLLKKYKRWTGSPTLGRRFAKEVLDRPNSFSRQDFEPLLNQWVNVLTAVRAPFKDGIMWKTGYGEPKASSPTALDAIPAHGTDATQNHPATGASAVGKGQCQMISSAKQIRNILDYGSAVEFDTALATSPLGSAAGKATYWVHSDNLVELQVLLLQHTKTPAFQGAPASPDDTVWRISRPSSSASEDIGDEVGSMVFDDLDRFAKSQTNVSISETEDAAGRATYKAAGVARWCADSEAVVLIRLSPDTDSQNKNSKEQTMIQTAKLKRKHLIALFDGSQTASPSNSLAEDTESDLPAVEHREPSSQSIANIRRWLAEHGQVRPLAQISSRRKRFVGLTNSTTSGAWGVLDRDITMKNPTLESLRDSDNGRIEDSMSFPHAVLEIGWEGENNGGLAKVLDQSHLTERVKGFTIETHAIAVLGKPDHLPPPHWLTTLDRDIRKVPTALKRGLRQQPSTRHSPESANAETNSVSASSTTGSPASGNSTAPAVDSSVTSVPDLLQSPPISAVKKKRKFRRQHPPQKETEERPRQYQQRYWNEFDDGSEASDEEGYILYVDPNSKSTFPGAATISRFASLLSRRTKGSSAKVKAWLHAQPKDDERRSLMTPQSDRTQDREVSALHQPASSRHSYATFADVEASKETSPRESMLFRTYMGCFFAATVILAISAVLAVTGRHRKRFTVDAGVIVGIVAGLVFSVLGVGTMLVRKHRLGWIHHVLVLLVFVGICVASGILLAFVTGGNF
ncbi:MAG: hypothetical protein M1835_006459 [Candelina submexicana]|nr:MAG: hypothetical protein M1835_006459 [Candelina submexicana]